MRLARILAQRMSATLGQQIVIENVTGGSGTIGIGRVARAAPDGYTVVIGNWASHVVNSAIFKTPFDYLNDFEPVARLSGNPYIIVGKNALPHDAARVHRLAEGQSRQGDGRHRRRGVRPACRRRLFPEGHRHALPVRSLSCRLVRRDARRRRRTHRLQHRSGDHVAALYPPGPGARLSRSRTASGLPPRPTFRPSTRPARPASM